MNLKIFTLILFVLGFYLEQQLRPVQRGLASELFPKTAQELVDKFDYQEIRKTALKILAKCPPENCTIIGLGRSPTPFMIFLQEMGSDAFTLPLSGFKLHPNSFDYHDKLIPKLHEHFDRYVDLQTVSNKKVMLIDFSLTGNSLMAAQYQLQEYFNSMSQSNLVNALAISNYPGHIESTAQSLKMPIPTVLMLDFSDLNKNLVDSRFDDYAEFKEAPVEKWGRVGKNPKYQQLVKHIAKLMDKDEQIKGLNISNFRDYLNIPERDYSFSCKNWLSDLIN